MSSWQQIKNGWGLEEVPKQYAQQLCCSWSHHELAPNAKLYTDQSLRTDGTVRGIDRMLELIRPRIFCKHHARLFFGD